MNKKIKVIDLLNKTANGEELPQRIRYRGMEFKYNYNTKKYHRDEDKYIWMCVETFSKERLNEEIEILEDNTKEIEELVIEKITTDERIKINELVRAVNQIRKENNK